MLALVARTNARAAVRRAAIKKLTGQDAIISIARNDSTEGVRKEVLRRVNDPAVAEEIRREDSLRTPLRKVRWGMSVDEVRQAEGMRLTTNDRGQLEGVDVEDFLFGKGVKMIFSFREGKLHIVVLQVSSTFSDLSFGMRGDPRGPFGAIDSVMVGASAAVDFALTQETLEDIYGEPDVGGETNQALWLRDGIAEFTGTLRT